MPSTSFCNLPAEILYLIFECLNKADIAYSFFQLNDYFALLVKYFIGKQLDLTKISDQNVFEYCLSTLLPSIGPNLRYLSIGAPYCLSNYSLSLKNSCLNLERLHVDCCTEKNDIRHYAAQLIHDRLMTLTLLVDNQVVGEQISLRLINRSNEKYYERISIASSLRLSLSSTNDLLLLKRYSESNYVADGFYTIECVSNGQWLTDTDDDLCLMSQKLQREYLFSVKQINGDQGCLEYELHNQQSQCPVTVLTCDEDSERWIPSSILLTHRKQSFRSCGAFTFERIDQKNQYYIRPCYPHAKRLRVSGKRIIVSVCDNDNETNHRFKLHRIL